MVQMSRGLIEFIRRLIITEMNSKNYDNEKEKWHNCKMIFSINVFLSLLPFFILLIVSESFCFCFFLITSESLLKNKQVFINKIKPILNLFIFLLGVRVG